MKTALYARVSSEKQDVDLSISAQLKALREYASKNGHEIVKEYVDEAESGKTTARPAFRDMIAAARRSQNRLILSLFGSIHVLPVAGKIRLCSRQCCAKTVSGLFQSTNLVKTPRPGNYLKP